jgi:hypothetical protein
MRALPALVLGGVAVGVLVGGAVAVTGGAGESSAAPDVPQPTVAADAAVNDLDTARAFLEGWWRSRTATYLAEGELVRTAADGSGLRLARTLVQRPPDVVLVQAGAVQAEVDGAILRCTVDPAGDRRCTSVGGGVDQRALARAELDRFAGYLAGDDPLYRLSGDPAAAGCFLLELRRAVPVAPYGEEVRVCFDDRTGAIVELRMVAGEVVDEILVTTVRPAVSDADLAAVLGEAASG